MTERLYKTVYEYVIWVWWPIEWISFFKEAHSSSVADVATPISKHRQDAYLPYPYPLSEAGRNKHPDCIWWWLEQIEQRRYRQAGFFEFTHSMVEKPSL